MCVAPHQTMPHHISIDRSNLSIATRTRLERIPLADAELGGVGAPEGVEQAVGAGQRHGVVAPARHLFVGVGVG